jgi:hypothetical protein
MIDLLASTVPENESFSADELLALKHEAFAAILDEEEPRLKADPQLVPSLRREMEAVKI